MYIGYMQRLCWSIFNFIFAVLEMEPMASHNRSALPLSYTPNPTPFYITALSVLGMWYTEEVLNQSP
jgi:hypothetical protein